METRWLNDNTPLPSGEGAYVKWYDHQFFLIIHNGKKFHGEIVEDRSEDNQLVVKINHRVFHLKRRGELDDLIASLGLDVPKIKRLKELVAPMPGRIIIRQELE